MSKERRKLTNQSLSGNNLLAGSDSPTSSVGMWPLNLE
jgi:hypothetical protein